tara:strand:- start:27308 stop:30067 length:2760 start_codon:yes stop_codon:yes gene_type:complete
MTTTPGIRQAAEQSAKASFDFDLCASPQERLPHYKAFLSAQLKALRLKHESIEAGKQICQDYTYIMDVLIRNIFACALATYKQTHEEACPEVSLFAVGGYGREELSPHSDIDLVLLCPKIEEEHALNALKETLANAILYPIWDLGLQVGYALRTTQECLEQSKNDIATLNAQLDARLVCGSKAHFVNYLNAFQKHFKKQDVHAYVHDYLEQQEYRHQKHETTVFLQEPDIKYGTGGLRDLQGIQWMGQMLLGSSRLDTLRKEAYLEKDEVLQLKQAYDFLLRVRNELHFQSKRYNNILTLDKQPKIASKLGYKGPALSAVEAFMKDYYTHAQFIYRLSQHVGRSFAKAKPAKTKKKTTPKLSEGKSTAGFILKDHTFSTNNKNVFKEDPERLIHIFRYCQELGAHLDFELQRLITKNLNLITDELRNSEQANATFLNILEGHGQVYPILSTMHSLGVLERFMPEFGKLSCLVQHELYHRYTVDAHTLNVIKELDQVVINEGKYARNYHEALEAVTNPTLLYLAALFHDIGKAYSIKRHALRGVAIAKPILKRLKISQESQEEILFIIEHHLHMARIWQKEDIDDVRTTQAFASFIENPDRLRHLYIHTFCDARGTTPSLWNPYKDTLHTLLYRRTLNEFTDQSELEKEQAQRKANIFEDLLNSTQEVITREEIEAHFNSLPSSYFSYNTQEEIEQHIIMVHELLQHIETAPQEEALLPVIHWTKTPDSKITTVHTVSWDRPGLFYKLASAFCLSGWNILGSKAISRDDNIILDTFHLECLSQDPAKQEKSKKLFQKKAREALIEGKDLIPEIISLQKKKKSFFTKPDINIEPKVDVVSVASRNQVIAHIEAKDHIGLLTRLSKTMLDHGFDISFARVLTENDVAQDTFHLKSLNPLKTLQKHQLDALREALFVIGLPEK